MKVWVQQWARDFNVRRSSLHIEFHHPTLFIQEHPGETLNRHYPVIAMWGFPTEIEVTDPVVLGQLAFAQFGIWLCDWGPILEDGN